MKKSLLTFVAAVLILPGFSVDTSAPEWMKGHHGIMVHWLYPKGGDIDRWTDAFDVQGFLDDFAASRADWLIFTVGQCRDAWASPNAALDRYAGSGFASRRDLVGEIAAGVHRLGKRFIAYSAIDQSCDCALNEKLCWNKDDPEHREFSRRMTDVIREWSLRWGMNCDGWWLDGASKVYYPNGFDCELWGKACRAGNPSAAIAYNPGQGDLSVFLASDYAAGEVLFARMADVPAIRSHVLFPIDGYWGAYWAWPKYSQEANPDFCRRRPEMLDAAQLERLQAEGRFPDPVYSCEELVRFIRAAEANGAGVTINVGIGETGRLNPKSVKLVAALASGAKTRRGRSECPVSSVRGIRINQVGYLPDAVKRAVVVDPPETRFRVQRFEADVRCHDVYEGMLRPIEGGLYEADLTPVTEPGDYRIVVGPVGDEISMVDSPGTMMSYAFVIGEGVYREAERAIISFFNHQRCGHADGWAGVCHQGRSRVLGTDQAVDLTGGFHQSCDLRKWADSSSFAVEALIRFAEAAPDDYLRGKAEEEIRWGLDYFQRLVSPEGFVYDCQFTPIGWKPFECWNRPAPMVAQTLVIRLLARGAAYFRERDETLSAACDEKARLACATLATHPDFANPYVQAVKNLPPGTQGTSFYTQSCRGNLNGDVLQASAELALCRATGDRVFLKDVEERATRILAQEREEEPGTFWLSAEKNVVALEDFRSGTLANELLLELYEMTRKAVYKEAFRRRLDWVLAQPPHSRQWTSPIVDNGALAFAAYRIFGDERYRQRGQACVDFMFGANDWESSCVGGFGYNPPPKNVYGQFFPSTPVLPGGVGVHLGGEYNLPQAGGLLRLLSAIEGKVDK